MSSCISTPTSLDAGNRSQSTPANGTSLVVDRGLGNWDDELAAEGPHVRHLLNDLVLQIPGKDEEVVRLRLAHHAGVEDREMRPRKEEPLLVRAAVDHVVEEITLDGDQGKVEGMLVIDGGDLAALDQPQQMRELHRHHSARFEEELEPFDEAGEVRHVSEHVVAHDQRAPLSFPAEPASGLEA